MANERVLTGGADVSDPPFPSMAEILRFSTATFMQEAFCPSEVSQQLSICHCQTGREFRHALATSADIEHLCVYDREFAGWTLGSMFTQYEFVAWIAPA